MDDEEDDFIFYGTPLPEIEDEAVLRKKAARELEVRDEKGRQRFHGAFTGGFSAGYFNTVGTKEGWTPSTFISSRNKTAERIQQNPEDFMDEEDLGEFGIATRRIHTSNKFKDSLNSEVKKRKFAEIDNIIPGEAPLKEIVKPVRDSIGIEILKKLGWRPGQGIGPRVKKNVDKVYGCALPDSLSLEEDDPYASLYTFAPNDVSAIFYQPKDNYFGIGYTGLSKESVLSARFDESNPTYTKSFLKKDKKKITISGQAFGVGAFEEDDEDIYSKDDMSQYDFSEFELESKQASSKSDLKAVSKTSSNILEGFCLASQRSLIKNYYPPPDLPKDFIPMFSQLSTQRSVHQTPSHSKLTSEERSHLLGEKKFQPAHIQVPLVSQERSQQTSIATNFSLNKFTFKPFPNDSAKQERYEEFLKLKDKGEIDKLVMPSSMTEWEKQQEIEEFSRAAMLFKPLSGALSSKFESKSHLSVEHEVMDAIEKAKKENNNKKLETKQKLVGLKNRKTLDWYPSSLLCKRFNVPNPYPDCTPSGSSVSEQSKSLFSHIIFSSPPSENIYEETQSSSSTYPSTSEKNLKTSTAITTDSEDDKKDGKFKLIETTKAELQDNQIEKTQKPPIDFFKDIFENTSSEEEDNNSSEEVVSQEVVPKPDTKQQTSTEPKSTTSENKHSLPKKSGFGVFANLDLDALNQRATTKNNVETTDNHIEPTSESTKTESKESQQISHTLTEPMQQDNLYGPDLPPNYSELPPVDYSKYLKKHKSKHKHKHQKHKVKKKKKKKSSHKSSDENSSDIDEDIDPAVILEKLKKVQKIL